MKKMISIIAILLMISLVFGCKAGLKKTTDDEGIKTEVVEPEPTEPQKVSSVTQEELDKLKADVEGLEAEDLAELSE